MLSTSTEMSAGSMRKPRFKANDVQFLEATKLFAIKYPLIAKNTQTAQVPIVTPRATVGSGSPLNAKLCEKSTNKAAAVRKRSKQLSPRLTSSLATFFSRDRL